MGQVWALRREKDTERVQVAFKRVGPPVAAHVMHLFWFSEVA